MTEPPIDLGVHLREITADTVRQITRLDVRDVVLSLTLREDPG